MRILIRECYSAEESYQCNPSVVSMIEPHHPHTTQPWVDISPKLAVGSLPSFLFSSAVEQTAVNRLVPGSIPGRGVPP